MNVQLHCLTALHPAARREPPVAVEVHRWYVASPDAVLDAWIDPGVARLWLFASASRPLAAAHIDARAGGMLRLVAGCGGETIDGRVEEITRPVRVRLTLAPGTPRSSSVSASVRAERGGTTLCVRHRGVRGHCADWLEGRWTGMLYGLGEAVDCDSHEFPFDLESR